MMLMTMMFTPIALIALIASIASMMPMTNPDSLAAPLPAQPLRLAF